jgi:type II secretory pathway pseudopilin PulG
MTITAEHYFELPQSVAPAAPCAQLDAPCVDAPMPPAPSSSAFTILEVCIAMTIAIIILSVATMSITGLKEEEALKETAALIETRAREAMLEAISHRRPVQIAISGIGSGSVEVKRYGEKDWRKPKADDLWEFDPTGICEPIELRITDTAGVLELAFDPLTACVRRKNLSIKER